MNYTFIDSIRKKSFKSLYDDTDNEMYVLM